MLPIPTEQPQNCPIVVQISDNFPDLYNQRRPVAELDMRSVAEKSKAVAGLLYGARHHTEDRLDFESASIVVFKAPPTVHDVALAEGAKLGLVYEGETPSFALMFVDPQTGVEVHRYTMYGYAPLGKESHGAAELARHIAIKHGPGRWWSSAKKLAEIVVHDGDYQYNVENLDGVPCVWMRSIYYHESAPRDSWHPGLQRA